MVIFLDAGHYPGFNKGANPKYAEGDMAIRLYDKLKTRLAAKGFTVLGTRSNLKCDVPVYDRGQKAAGADLLVSLHSNAASDANVKRVVVIVPFQDQNGTYALADKLGNKVTEVMGIDQKYQRYVRTYTDDRGRTQNYYGIIRGAVNAGCKRVVLIEHGFHTNKDVSTWLLDERNLDKLADAEAEIIASSLPRVTVAQTYKVGDPYVVKKNDIYTTGRAVAAFAVGQVMTVKQVLPGKILLAEINSWIKANT